MAFDRRYPEGRLNADDDGETKVAVCIKSGKLLVRFQQPTAWIGMGADQAEAFGKVLISGAKRLRDMKAASNGS